MGNWKKVGGLFLAAIMLVALAACGGMTTGGSATGSTSGSADKGQSTTSSNSGQSSTSSKKAKLTIKLAGYMPTGTATSNQQKEIAQKIEEMSNGAIKVDSYPGGSLLDESAIGKGLQNNTVQMAIMGLHWWHGQVPASNFSMIPGLTPQDPNKYLSELKGKLGDDVKNLFKSQGVTIVGWGYYGYAGAYINQKHKVAKPSDLKGLKMRADGAVAATEMKHFGAIPQNMDSSEVYQAMQRGTIVGATSGVASFVSRKWIETAKYMTAIKQITLVYPIFVNTKWWNGLSKKQQQTITKAVAATEQDNIKAINDGWNNGIKQAKKEGVHVIEIDQNHNSNLMKLWAQKTQFMKNYYLKQAGPAGKTIVNDFSNQN